LSVPVDLLQFSESISVQTGGRLAASGGKEKKGVWFRLIVKRGGKEQERWPTVDVIRFDLPTQEGKPVFWGV